MEVVPNNIRCEFQVRNIIDDSRITDLWNMASYNLILSCSVIREIKLYMAMNERNRSHFEIIFCLQLCY